jgi:predicted site-specific integrase-resolvase
MLRTTKEVATRFRIKETTLEQWRWNGKGPKYTKLGRCVRYRDEDLEEFNDLSSEVVA